MVAGGVLGCQWGGWWGKFRSLEGRSLEEMGDAEAHWPRHTEVPGLEHSLDRRAWWRWEWFSRRRRWGRWGGLSLGFLFRGEDVGKRLAVYTAS